MSDAAVSLLVQLSIGSDAIGCERQTSIDHVTFIVLHKHWNGYSRSKNALKTTYPANYIEWRTNHLGLIAKYRRGYVAVIQCLRTILPVCPMSRSVASCVACRYDLTDMGNLQRADHHNA